MDLNSLRNWESSGPVPFNVEDFNYDQMAADDGTGGSPGPRAGWEEEAAEKGSLRPQDAPLTIPGDEKAAYDKAGPQEGGVMRGEGYTGQPKAASTPGYQGAMETHLHKLVGSRQTDKAVQQVEGASLDARRSSGKESEKTLPPSESLHMGGSGYRMAPPPGFGRGYYTGYRPPDP